MLAEYSQNFLDTKIRIRVDPLKYLELPFDQTVPSIYVS
jgi:hypothetical protein